MGGDIIGVGEGGTIGVGEGGVIGAIEALRRRGKEEL